MNFLTKIYSKCIYLRYMMVIGGLLASLFVYSNSLLPGAKQLFVYENHILRSKIQFLNDSCCTISEVYKNPHIPTEYREYCMEYRYSKSVPRQVPSLRLEATELTLTPIGDCDTADAQWIAMPDSVARHLDYRMQYDPNRDFYYPDGTVNQIMIDRYLTTQPWYDREPQAAIWRYQLNPMSVIKMIMFRSFDGRAAIHLCYKTPRPNSSGYDFTQPSSMWRHSCVTGCTLRGKMFCCSDSICTQQLYFTSRDNCRYIQTFPGRDDNLQIVTDCSYECSKGRVILHNLHDTIGAGVRLMSDDERSRLSPTEVCYDSLHCFDRAEVSNMINNIQHDTLVYSQGYLYYSKLYSTHAHPTRHLYRVFCYKKCPENAPTVEDFPLNY